MYFNSLGMKSAELCESRGRRGTGSAIDDCKLFAVSINSVWLAERTIISWKVVEFIPTLIVAFGETRLVSLQWGHTVCVTVRHVGKEYNFRYGTTF